MPCERADLPASSVPAVIDYVFCTKLPRSGRHALFRVKITRLSKCKCVYAREKNLPVRELFNNKYVIRVVVVVVASSYMDNEYK